MHHDIIRMVIQYTLNIHIDDLQLFIQHIGSHTSHIHTTLTHTLTHTQTHTHTHTQHTHTHIHNAQIDNTIII